MLIWQAHKGKIESAAFSSDGKLLATATGSARYPYLWNPTTGTLVQTLKGASGAVRSVCFAPDAPLLVAGTAESVIVWNTDTWEVIRELKMRHARELAIGPGASPILVASDYGGVQSWNDLTDPGSQPGRFAGSKNLAAVHISPDGRFLVTSDSGSAHLWHAADRKPIVALRTASTATQGTVRFSLDSRRVAITYGKWVEVWPVPDGSGPLPVVPDLAIEAGQGRSSLLWGVSWTADGTGLLTAGTDGSVRVWDAITGAERKTFDWQIGRLYCVAFAPDGLTCAACGSKGQVVVWDVDA